MMKIALSAFGLVAGAAAFAPLQQRSVVHRRPASRLYVKQESLDGAQAMIDAIIDEKNCNPFFVRLAWHDR